MGRCVVNSLEYQGGERKSETAKKKAAPGRGAGRTRYNTQRTLRMLLHRVCELRMQLTFACITEATKKWRTSEWATDTPKRAEGSGPQTPRRRIKQGRGSGNVKAIR